MKHGDHLSKVASFLGFLNLGYGNQAPSSMWGRIMTACVGFFSIIFFAAVLTNAGQIVAYLVSDFSHRIKSRMLVKKQVMAFIWGILWIVWMGYLGFMFQQWELYRLGEENSTVTYQDGIWWAFVSTATIGLGDFYLGTLRHCVCSFPEGISFVF